MITAAAAIIGWLLAVVVIWGWEYGWRFVTGRAPRNSRRTLLDRDLRYIRAELMASAPLDYPRERLQIYAVADLSEVTEFATELAKFCEESGWEGSFYSQWPLGTIKDVEIWQQSRGNVGLVALHCQLGKWGYKSRLHKYLPGNDPDNASIVIGEATH